MHSLNRLKYFLPSDLKRILAQTLVMPNFDYCEVLLTDLNDGLTHKTQNVQNMCIRYIFNIRKYDHSSSFRELCWLILLHDRRKMYSLTLLFKILHVVPLHQVIYLPTFIFYPPITIWAHGRSRIYYTFYIIEHPIILIPKLYHIYC